MNLVMNAMIDIYIHDGDDFSVFLFIEIKTVQLELIYDPYLLLIRDFHFQIF